LKEGERKKGKEGKEKKRKKRKKEKKKRKERKRKGEKDLEELEEILGKIRREGKRVFGGTFRVFGCRRDFRDGGGGEAGRPAGCGWPGIPVEVADRGAVAAMGGMTRWPE
jgi:hypothetical protein